MPVNWTENRLRKLRILWEQGYTARAIAKAIGQGCTKNAVIGKKTRLGFTRGTSSEQPIPPEIVFTPKPKPKPKKISYQKVYRKSSSPKSLKYLKNRECRYPVNQAKVGEEHRFCAKPTDVAKSYCPEHYDVVWRPSRRFR
jgi:hypothetical protein